MKIDAVMIDDICGNEEILGRWRASEDIYTLLHLGSKTTGGNQSEETDRS